MRLSSENQIGRLAANMADSASTSQAWLAEGFEISAEGWVTGGAGEIAEACVGLGFEPDQKGFAPGGLATRVGTGTALAKNAPVSSHAKFSIIPIKRGWLTRGRRLAFHAGFAGSD